MITRSNIKTLCDYCQNLLQYSTQMESADDEIVECNQNIRRALRKLIIGNEIANRLVVAVAGLQGVGKTTMMKNYFKLDSKEMNIASERGERIPVFMTVSSDAKKPTYYSYELVSEGNSYNQKKQEIDSNEFIQLSKGEEESTMFLEAVLPKEDNDALVNISFMLLPGYENADDYWDELIKYSINCSDTAIIVMDPTKVSGKDNETFTKFGLDKFGDHLIFAITWSETAGSEERKASLMENIGISPTEEDRVVCVGAYPDDSENEKWRKHLRTAIEKYALLTNRSHEARNNEYLEGILSKEIAPNVARLKDLAKEVEDVPTKSRDREALRCFEKAVFKIRRAYDKELYSNLSSSREKDLDALRSEVDNENPFANFVRKLNGASLHDMEKAEKMLDMAMNENGKYRFQKALEESILKCTFAYISMDEKLLEEANDKKAFEGLKNLPSIKVSENPVALLQDIRTILSKNSDNNILLNENLNDTMYAIAECSTKYFGLYCSNTKGLQEYSEKYPLANCKLTPEEVKSSLDETSKFLAAGLGIAGIDVAADGVFDLGPTIAKALGIANPLVGIGILAGGYAVGAVVSMIRDNNRIKLDDYYALQKALYNFYDDLRNKYLEEYDYSMQLVKERIEEYFDKSEDDGVVLQSHNTIVTAKNIKSLLDVMKKEIESNAYDPGVLAKQ